MSQFHIVDAPEPQQWEAFVREHPRSSIFHTPHMAEVYRGTRYHTPLVLAALENGRMLALLAAVRVQTLPDPLGSISSRSIFYAEPLCHDDDRSIAALTALLAEHDARMQNRVLFTEVRPLYAPGPEKAALTQARYEFEEYLNYLTDLRQPKEATWNAMTRQCRGNIRHGQREGVEIRDVTTPEGVNLLYPLLQASYEHARVPMADKSLFVSALRTLQPSGMMKLLIAFHKGTPVGGDMLLLYKGRVYDWYRGLERIKSLYPGECMVWHQLAWAHDNGFEVYDYAGAGWPNKPYGVRNFKAKFGGQLVNFGRYRKIYSARKFNLAEKVYGLKRSIALSQVGVPSLPER